MFQCLLLHLCLLGQCLLTDLLAPLYLGIILSLHLALHFLGTEPEISQPGCAVLLQLCVSFVCKLLQTLIVSDHLSYASILNLLEERDCSRGAT